jgi:hypothetical protein
MAGGIEVKMASPSFRVLFRKASPNFTPVAFSTSL